MSLKMKKARSVVMDLSGVVATKDMMTTSNVAKEFMKEHLQEYLKEEWGLRGLRSDVALIRKKQEKRSREHMSKPRPPLVAEVTAPVLQQYESVVKNLFWRLENDNIDPDPGILASVHLNLNDWAYRKGILRTP